MSPTYSRQTCIKWDWGASNCSSNEVSRYLRYYLVLFIVSRHQCKNQSQLRYSLVCKLITVCRHVPPITSHVTGNEEQSSRGDKCSNVLGFKAGVEKPIFCILLLVLLHWAPFVAGIKGNTHPETNKMLLWT